MSNPFEEDIAAEEQELQEREEVADAAVENSNVDNQSIKCDEEPEPESLAEVETAKDTEQELHQTSEPLAIQDPEEQSEKQCEHAADDGETKPDTVSVVSTVVIPVQMVERDETAAEDEAKHETDHEVDRKSTEDRPVEEDATEKKAEEASEPLTENAKVVEESNEEQNKQHTVTVDQNDNQETVVDKVAQDKHSEKNSKKRTETVEQRNRQETKKVVKARREEKTKQQTETVRKVPEARTPSQVEDSTSRESVKQQRERQVRKVPDVPKNPFFDDVDEEYQEIDEPKPAYVQKSGFRSSNFASNYRLRDSDGDQSQFDSRLLAPPFQFTHADDIDDDAASSEGGAISYKAKRKRFDRSELRQYLRSVYSILKLFQVFCCICGIICASVASISASWWSSDLAKFVEIVFGIGIGWSSIQFSLNLADTLLHDKKCACGKLSLRNDSVWSCFDLVLSGSWSIVTLVATLICAFASFNTHPCAAADSSSTVSEVCGPGFSVTSHNAMLPGAVFASLAFGAYLTDTVLSLLRCLVILRQSMFENVIGISLTKRKRQRNHDKGKDKDKERDGSSSNVAGQSDQTQKDAC